MNDDVPREAIERLIHDARGRNILAAGEVTPLDVGVGLTPRDGETQIMLSVVNPRRPKSDRVVVFFTAGEARAYIDELTWRSLTAASVAVHVRMECGCGCRRYFDIQAPPVWVSTVVDGLRDVLAEMEAAS